MKKTVSLCLAVLMLFSAVLTANAVQTNNQSSYADDTGTFYFLAPRTEEVNYFALNDEVGYWYWGSGTDGNVPYDTQWPGLIADKAPEIGKDVYKINISEEAIGLIFNAYVDAYEDDSYDTLDPNKAPFAFQTADITDIEVYPGNDHRNQIYVLDLSTTETTWNGHRTSGKWFSIDPDSSNYYRFSDWYKAYNIKNDTDTPDSPTPYSPKPDDTNKKYHADDTVTVTYNIHDIKNFGAANSIITYNADILEVDDNAFSNKRGEGMWFRKEIDNYDAQIAVNNTNDGIKIGLLTSDPEYGSNYADETDIITVQFKAKTDFNEDELGISLTTKRLMKVVEYGTTNITDSASDYISIIVTLPETADTNTDTETDVTSDTDTDSETDVTSDTDTDSETDVTSVTDTDSENDVNTNTDTDKKDTDSDKKNTDSDKKDSDADKPKPSEPVKKLKVGDVDGDNNISSGDALIVLRYSVKLETFTDEQIQAADVNKDDVVNSADALFILRRSVKLKDNGTYFED